MVTVTVAKAKAHLSALLHKIEDGCEVVITRYGRPIARLSAVRQRKAARQLKKPVPDLSAFRATMPRLRKSSVARLGELRDKAR